MRKMSYYSEMTENPWNEKLQEEYRRIQTDLFRAMAQKRKWTAALVEKRKELAAMRKKISDLIKGVRTLIR